MCFLLYKKAHSFCDVVGLVLSIIKEGDLCARLLLLWLILKNQMDASLKEMRPFVAYWKLESMLTVRELPVFCFFVEKASNK